MNEAIEKLLLEPAHHAFSMLRIVRVRVQAARVAYRSNARTIR
ncbi:MAG: hypothetical protein QOJ70_1331 [Acidobacteriota bacterium]|jgi:hypothetical protein|nr:hypothetical protein [Acidobacteriota bacterium]